MTNYKVELPSFLDSFFEDIGEIRAPIVEKIYLQTQTRNPTTKVVTVKDEYLDRYNLWAWIKPKPKTKSIWINISNLSTEYMLEDQFLKRLKRALKRKCQARSIFFT